MYTVDARCCDVFLNSKTAATRKREVKREVTAWREAGVREKKHFLHACVIQLDGCRDMCM